MTETSTLEFTELLRDMDFSIECEDEHGVGEPATHVLYLKKKCCGYEQSGPICAEHLDYWWLNYPEVASVICVFCQERTLNWKPKDDIVSYQTL